MNWLIVAIFLLLAHKEYLASPTPLKLPGHTQRLTPYIRHWEAANFDRGQLHEAHQQHVEQKRHRRKRALGATEYGPAHTIRLNFFAHDREFRLVLRQDPLSVFAGDVEIENTLGPLDYDISRIYTGSLEDDENAHVHAVLTHDNLLDGTIETSSEHYYVEPAHRYSSDLLSSGVHSIVYKVSDVDMQRPGPARAASASASAPPSPASASPATSAELCASERLRRSTLLDDLKRRKAGGADPSWAREATGTEARSHVRGSSDARSVAEKEAGTGAGAGAGAAESAPGRRKRWLPDELSSAPSDDRDRDRDPPLPLDLDVPYNDDFSIFTRADEKAPNPATATATATATTAREKDKERVLQKGSVVTWRNAGAGGAPAPGFTPSSTTKSSRNRNIIVNSFNPNAATVGEVGGAGSSSSSNNNLRKTYTKHKNIIVSTYNRTNNNNYNYNGNNYNSNFNSPYDDEDSSSSYNDNGGSNNFINNFFNTNWTTMFNANDRPSHKTHVEIITKNGATKKPNIIVNNYNPDILLTPTHNNNNHNPSNHQHPNFNSMLMTSVLGGRGQDGGDGSGSGSSSARALYDRKITCMLYLQADHTFFQKMGSDEASIEAITRHVQRANTIYKNTDFNNDGKPDNITFMIKRIKVHNTNALKDPAYRFPGNYGVEKFLELFSEEDYDAFCLAYMFTYRDFEMGTLGLAWTGDLKNAGGVCEKNGHYRGSLKSLNTGIVTLLNYGKHVPPAVSHVTLAHEIGHNFGSPHDPEQCTPGGEDGNFIMFARATSGDKKNNNKFSPCSLKSIEPVLNAKARSVKGCFTEPQTSICGNGVVETGEQCDCGWEEDCKDACCFPMSRHPRLDEKPCTLTPRAKCSPSQGPCCTTDCQLKRGDKCRDDNGCRDPSFCDGRMPQCPPSVNKPNKTICNKEFVCYMGDCTGSICLAYGLESCQCIPGPQDDKIKSCELCCKLPGEDNPCRSSFEWNEPPFDVPDMYAKPGTPCNDYNGYCDVFQKCREVDPSGPLATLRKLLLSEESIATFKKWMQHNWYTVALAVVGVFVLLILSTKLLAKRSNLKLKSVTIIHSATTETVRLPDDNNGVIVHTAVRTKVPFKKKVRGERSTSNKLSSGGATKKPGHKAAGRPKPAAAGEHQLKKPARTKKNRVAAPPGATGAPGANANANAAAQQAAADPKAAGVGGGGGGGDPKKAKKFKKHSKEIIDYSARNAQTSAALVSGSASASGAHTNTFGKVQKWLLESPIVAQPLSHIEHSSKVRKVMAKSQSTPERLVQKSPQKTKSMGSLAGGDKVKLQVVYKPPFKFSLRLSKGAKVKTHVVAGGAPGKMKARKTRTGAGPGPANESKRQAGAGVAGERTKRTALLLRAGREHEDSQVLTLSEPNYETLNPKTAPAQLENPFYENMLSYAQSGEAASGASGGGGSGSGSGSGGAPKMSRSSSKTQLDAKAAAPRPPHSYSRSNSLTPASNGNGNPFAAAGSRGSRKLSDSNSTNLSRNFGSTQNLIHASQTNLAKSKKRSSLNLKSGLARAGGAKDAAVAPQPAKRSSSNSNLRRDSSATNLPAEAPPAPSSHLPPLRRSSSSTAHQQQQPQPQPAQQQKLPTYAAQRSARASFSNIPRASLSGSGPGAVGTAAASVASSSSSSAASANHGSNGSGSSFNFSRQSPPAAALAAPLLPSHAPSSNNAASSTPPSSYASSHGSSHAEHRRSRSSLTSTAHQHQPQPQQQQQRSNSIRQHPHNHHPPPLPASASAGPTHLQERERDRNRERERDRDRERERELPSDLEVMVSDVENLVS